MKIDLTELPDASRYEDRYQQYMDIFKTIAHTPPEDIVTIEGAPWCWVPLLHHLNCQCWGSRVVFEHCRAVEAASWWWDRTALEVLCGFRPECVDALWKCDMQWKIPAGRVRKYKPKKEFIVTNNGSFHRPEVLKYMDHLAMYRPTKENVLIVPCAADKPYPSPLHKMCMDLMPDDFYIMNATGVLGLVPQDLWNVMPHYDSGIPNEWRLYKTVLWYFSHRRHNKVVVYCDFYSTAIQHALDRICQSARFVLPPKIYDDYVDLTRPDLLVKLESALNT
jgi:Domain of unknown function (DUF5591)